MRKIILAISIYLGCMIPVLSQQFERTITTVISAPIDNPPALTAEQVINRATQEAFARGATSEQVEGDILVVYNQKEWQVLFIVKPNSNGFIPLDQDIMIVMTPAGEIMDVGL